MRTSYSRSTFVTIVLVLLCTSLIFVAPHTASASIWELTATPAGPNGYGTAPFWIQFDDSNNDQVVYFGDIIAHSTFWYDYDGHGVAYGPVEFPSFDKLPLIDSADGVDNLTVVGSPDPDGRAWHFYIPDPDGWYPNSSPFDTNWTYTAEVVPIPGAVWLLGSGLIGIVGIRRKFKK